MARDGQRLYRILTFFAYQDSIMWEVGEQSGLLRGRHDALDSLYAGASSLITVVHVKAELRR